MAGYNKNNPMRTPRKYSAGKDRKRPKADKTFYFITSQSFAVGTSIAAVYYLIEIYKYFPRVVRELLGSLSLARSTLFFS
jgi:hypothetical protein